VPTKEEKESLIKLLTKKHLTFTKESGETVKVTVTNNSHSYSLRNGQKEPDEYHFSIDLEKFDREAEINKLLDELEQSYGLTFLATNAVTAIRDLLIDKGIFTEEEYNSKMDISKEKTKKLSRESAEKVIDEKFKSK